MKKPIPQNVCSDCEQSVYCINQIIEFIDNFTDELRKSNDMWRINQDEVSDKIIEKLKELKIDLK